MSLLSKLFGGKSDLEKMQRALQQRSYAEALHIGEDLLAAGNESDLLSAGLLEAADGLARLNLDEGLRSQQAGNLILAAEHLQLAKSQARSEELLKEIELALAETPAAGLFEEAVQDRSETQSASGCDSCAPTLREADGTGEELPDMQSQIELIIASYPAEMQQRYLSRSNEFLKAFLLLHSGEDQQALPLFDEVPREERDELYLFELGCLNARLGESARGIALLKQALELDAGNALVLDSLISLLLEKRDYASALKLLQQQVDAGANPAFCHARLCELKAAAQETSAAFASARKAIAAGYSEPSFLVLASGLFEAAGLKVEAEQLLARLPGGGCSGGVSLPLAEFWLRENRELGKVLDTFNDACRKEPDNPRWQLRVAQTYLARNWRKQGIELLGRVVGDPRLDEALKLEAEQLLAKA